MKRSSSLGVDWFMPRPRGGYAGRPFATTTKVTSILVEALAGEGHTVQSAHDEIRFDADARVVLAAMAEAGFGDRPLSEFVRADRPWKGHTSSCTA